eukprot:3534884-Karenia_brevis.AAC.1
MTQLLLHSPRGVILKGTATRPFWADVQDDGESEASAGDPSLWDCAPVADVVEWAPNSGAKGFELVSTPWLAASREENKGLCSANTVLCSRL